MKLDILPIGLYEENSYILHDHDHVLLVDPGRNYKVIASKIAQRETVDAILLTHGHSDHTGAVDDLVELYHCPVYMNYGDLPLTDPSAARRPGSESAVYTPINDLPAGDMTIGNFPITVYHTKGHTQGSVLIRCRNRLFTGDTLFAGDIGRMDLFGGDEDDMYESLQKIKALPNDLEVYPGHGPSSTIAKEKQHNPYLR